jgi:hypothetical protein
MPHFRNDNNSGVFMKRTLLALALSTAALSANAADLNYNYVQGSYNSVDIDGADLDGFGIKGSLKFNDMFYGIAGYESYSEGDSGLDETGIGLGFRKSLNAKTDWINELSYVHDSADAGYYGDVSDSGYRVATGLRGMVGENVELTGKLNYADVGDFGNGIGVNLGGVYHVNETFGITAGYDYADRGDTDLNSWNVGARVSF